MLKHPLRRAPDNTDEEWAARVEMWAAKAKGFGLSHEIRGDTVIVFERGATTR